MSSHNGTRIIVRTKKVPATLMYDKMAKTALNTPLSYRAPAAGPTVQRKSARLAKRKASSRMSSSSSSVPLDVTGRSQLTSPRVTESQPSAQLSASPTLSPESPMLLRSEPPSPQSSGRQSRHSPSCSKSLRPSRPPFLLPTPPSPKPLSSQCSVLSQVLVPFSNSYSILRL